MVSKNRIDKNDSNEKVIANFLNNNIALLLILDNIYNIRYMFRCILFF